MEAKKTGLIEVGFYNFEMNLPDVVVYFTEEWCIKDSIVVILFK